MTRWKWLYSIVVPSLSLAVVASACSTASSGGQASGPSIPDTALGAQIRYAIELANGQAPVTSYAAHFSDQFLAQVPAARITSVVDQTRPAATWRLERFLMGPGALDAVLLLKSRLGTQTKVTVSIDPGTHLINGLLFEPYGAQSAARAGAASPDLAAKAEQVTADLAAGNFSAVSAQFDATVSAGLSASALAAAWQQVAGPLGAYKGHGTPIFKALTPGYQTFFVPTQFESGSIEVQVAFDSSGKIAGFYLRPAGFDQSL